MDSLNSIPGTPNSAFYKPLLISVIGVLSTCIALVVYHFILIRYCRRNPQTQTTPNARILPTGVDHKLLETIPITAYSSTKPQGGDNALFRVDRGECVVCLGELEHGEMVRLLPNCKHAFHVPCIDQWFAAHASCPVCRSPIVAPAVRVNDDIPPSPHPPLQVLTASSSSSSSDVGSNRVELPGQDYGNDASSSSSSGWSGFKRQRSFGLLRHCGSLVLPTERASSSARLMTSLKRSFSMDQCSVIIEMQRESGRGGSSSSAKDDDDDDAVTSIFTARSIRHFDSVSAKLLSSISRLRSRENTEILPY